MSDRLVSHGSTTHALDPSRVGPHQSGAVKRSLRPSLDAVPSPMEHVSQSRARLNVDGLKNNQKLILHRSLDTLVEQNVLTHDEAQKLNALSAPQLRRLMRAPAQSRFFHAPSKDSAELIRQAVLTCAAKQGYDKALELQDRLTERYAGVGKEKLMGWEFLKPKSTKKSSFGNELPPAERFDSDRLDSALDDLATKENPKLADKHQTKPEVSFRQQIDQHFPQAPQRLAQLIDDGFDRFDQIMNEDAFLDQLEQIRASLDNIATDNKTDGDLCEAVSLAFQELDEYLEENPNAKPADKRALANDLLAIVTSFSHGELQNADDVRFDTDNPGSFSRANAAQHQEVPQLAQEPAAKPEANLQQQIDQHFPQAPQRLAQLIDDSFDRFDQIMNEDAFRGQLEQVRTGLDNIKTGNKTDDDLCEAVSLAFQELEEYLEENPNAKPADKRALANDLLAIVTSFSQGELQTEDDVRFDTGNPGSLSQANVVPQQDPPQVVPNVVVAPVASISYSAAHKPPAQGSVADRFLEKASVDPRKLATYREGRYYRDICLPFQAFKDDYKDKVRDFSNDKMFADFAAYCRENGAAHLIDAMEDLNEVRQKHNSMLQSHKGLENQIRAIKEQEIDRIKNTYEELRIQVRGDKSQTKQLDRMERDEIRVIENKYGAQIRSIRTPQANEYRQACAHFVQKHTHVFSKDQSKATTLMGNAIMTDAMIEKTGSVVDTAPYDTGLRTLFVALEDEFEAFAQSELQKPNSPHAEPLRAAQKSVARTVQTRVENPDVYQNHFDSLTPQRRQQVYGF